ncbi:hypothetical protein [uncultured Nostoc sp.]|uniref:hypothetical protein n=1 Tax=uncultured Nostoc sp. TaxID=340711 RepID=UPI0035CBFDD1
MIFLLLGPDGIGQALVVFLVVDPNWVDQALVVFLLVDPDQLRASLLVGAYEFGYTIFVYLLVHPVDIVVVHPIFVLILLSQSLLDGIQNKVHHTFV